MGFWAWQIRMNASAPACTSCVSLVKLCRFSDLCNAGIISRIGGCGNSWNKYNIWVTVGAQQFLFLHFLRNQDWNVPFCYIYKRAENNVLFKKINIPQSEHKLNKEEWGFGELDKLLQWSKNRHKIWRQLEKNSWIRTENDTVEQKIRHHGMAGTGATRREKAKAVVEEMAQWVNGLIQVWAPEFAALTPCRCSAAVPSTLRRLQWDGLGKVARIVTCSTNFKRSY